MNTVKYNFATNVLRLNYPNQWDPKLVSAATVAVHNMSAVELQAADAATIPASTTTRLAMDRFSTTLYLDAGYAETPSIGDIMKVVGVGGSEVVIVKGWDGITKNVEIDNVLKNEYESGAAVYPMYAVYTLDTTDTDAYTNGMQIRITWTPTGSGNETDQIFEVLQTILELEGFEDSFRSLYPRAYDVLSKTPGRMADIFDVAEMRLHADLKSDGLDLYRVKDQRIVKPVLMALAAKLYTLNGDAEMADEREALMIDYDDRLETMKRLPIWVDTDLDNKRETGEVDSHQTYFERGW